MTVDGAKVIMGGYTTIEGLAVRKLTTPADTLYLATSTVSPAARRQPSTRFA